jgi:hypothetical protein
MAINEDKLNEFLGRFVTDLGATVAAGNVMIGRAAGASRAGDARRVRPCRAHPDGGFAISAGFQAGTTVAVVVAIAVISHDFAGGFTTCTITSLYGNNRWRR